MSMNTSKDVLVLLRNFSNLADMQCPLALDNYQRAYVWNVDKINQLLNDLLDFIHQGKEGNYYMGTLLLHEKNNALYVIDGQQRLTSLAILHWLLKENKLPEYIQFLFRSDISRKNVLRTKQAMQSWFALHPKAEEDLGNVFNRLCFTVIQVTREDLAFTFFDTQNNRGVPLGSTDLLKAFHLRAIHSEDAQREEQLQSHCAKRWEQVQFQNQANEEGGNYDFAPELFHYYLWRARNWRGNEVVELEGKDEMLLHFGERTKKMEKGEVRLYPAGANQWGEVLSLTSKNDFYLKPISQQLSAESAYLPFALRQPISRGVGFFLYAEKYAMILKLLLKEPSISDEINAIQKFYQEVVRQLSPYLQNLFCLAWLMYFDRLGTKDLLRFTLWLDYRIGAIRLKQEDIRRQTPLKFLREEKRNLLDVIAHAYECDDIVDFLKQVDVSEVYQSENGWKNAITSENCLVKERYARAIAKYYNLPSLSEKTPQFIEHFIQEHLVSKRQSIH